MENERYSILFSSLTGNTKKLADTLREVLPKEDCDYFGAPEAEVPPSEMLYIGFGTAGFGGSEAYFQNILNRVKASIDPSNSVVGEYMCQGKMPQSVRERYQKMKAQPEHPANMDALIENFDRALSHPDARDLERLKEIVLK